MSKNYYTKFFPFLLALFFFFSLCPCSKANAQTDTVFWFAASEISELGGSFPPGDRPIVFRLITGNQTTHVVISQPAAGGMPIKDITVPPNTTETVDLTNWINNIETKPANTVLNYGLKIVSDYPISAYYQNISGGTTGSINNPEVYTLKGQNALGTDFWIAVQDKMSNDSVRDTPMPKCSFTIVATSDQTVVNITPSHNIVGHSAGIPFNITLNKGQTYAAMAVSSAAQNHLQGSHVTSNKPVAITVTDDDPVYYTSCADVGGDQIVPTSLLGQKYAAINGALLESTGDEIFITATTNNTVISKNGTAVTTINAGTTWNFEMTGSAAYIEANHPVAVWQVSGVGCQTGQTQLPKLNCTGSKFVSYTRSVEGDLVLNIIVASGGENDFSINGNTGLLTGAQFAPIPGSNGQWLYCRLPLSSSSYPIGTILNIRNAKTNFQLGVLEGNTYLGASYGYFSNYNGTLPIGITAQPNPACEGDDIQLSTNNVGGANYHWQGPNGFSSTIFNPLLADVDTSDAGIYTLHVENGNVGCDQSGSIQIDINSLPVVDLGPDTSICEGDRITLQTKGVYPTALYNWSTGASAQAIQVSDSGTYSLTITNLPDCKGSDAVHIAIHHCDCYVHIPNAFSPNGDGRNDVFAPGLEISCSIDKYLLRVYNRYGQLIFSSVNRNEGWDGYYNHKKADLGTYFFYITYEEYATGLKKSVKGDLTLIR